MPKKNNKARAMAPTLAERIENLSAKRQEVIRPILEHPREYVLLSVRAMAQRLKTDPATIVRIVRGLGFASYREFRQHLHDLSIAFATSLDTMKMAGGKETSVPAHLRQTMEQDFKNLQGLKNSLDPLRILAAAKRLYSARRILILAGDLAEALAYFLDYQGSILGLPFTSATSSGRIAHLVRNVTSRDVVIAISFRRGLRQTVEGVEQARARGAYCIGIADTFVSPLARQCDELFLAPVESPSYAASYVAPMALLNALLSACGELNRPKTMALIKQVAEEQRKGFRWYSA